MPPLIFKMSTSISITPLVPLGLIRAPSTDSLPLPPSAMNALIAKVDVLSQATDVVGVVGVGSSGSAEYRSALREAIAPD
jgi:hypothetical protein